jgi:glycosyltransferase involved in cell wall biosynthesis
MHGCYELFLRHPDAAWVVPKGLYALQQAAAFVYLTDKNLEVFSRPAVRALASLPHQKIYNGFEGQFSAPTERPSRAALNIGPADLVFGMVARGIAEKGWEFAIRSFLAVAEAQPQAHLLLVGSSDYLTELRTRYTHPRLHFAGHSPNPIDWVSLFDVGLLPSYFHAESLPNSIAEYLACGKPVVASRIGEVPQMLATDTGPAGILLDQANWQLTRPEQLTEAMHTYLTQPALLAEHSSRAALAFRKFDMSHCVAAYVGLYKTALAGGGQ